ncbi:hypothetical protein ACIPI6_15095 [Pseudomonas protegens]|uniref:hypothetical protein n=1 Tax=Pseudomonas protegens TaxID=380021 RepID=UPI003816E4C1
MNKHTPGPWVARPVPNAGVRGHTGYAIDFNEDQEQVVDFVYEEADARLIAGAPDLLEALQDLTDDIAERFDMDSPSTNPGIKHCIDAARAAIAKATQ